MKLKYTFIVLILLFANFFLKNKASDAGDPNEIKKMIFLGYKNQSIEVKLSNLRKINFCAEFIMKLIIMYLINIMRFSSIILKESYVEECNELKNLLGPLESQSSFNRRSDFILKSDMEKLNRQFLEIAKVELLNFMEELYVGKSVDYLDFIYINKDEMSETIGELLGLLKFFLQFITEVTLETLIIVLTNYTERWLGTFYTTLEKFSKLDRKSCIKTYNAGRSFADQVIIMINLEHYQINHYLQIRHNSISNKQRVEDYKKRKENKDSMEQNEQEDVLIEQYFNNNGASEETIFKLECLATMALTLLLVGARNMLSFQGALMEEFASEIVHNGRYISSMIKARGTEANLSEDFVLSVREELVQQLEFETMDKCNFLARCLNKTLFKEDIMSYMKKIYSLLLRIFSLLKSELSKKVGGKYVSFILSLVEKLYTKGTKLFLEAIKKFEKDQSSYRVITAKENQDREEELSLLKKALSLKIKSEMEEKLKKEELKLQVVKTPDEDLTVTKEKKKRNKGKTRRRLAEIKDIKSENKPSVSEEAENEESIKTPVKFQEKFEENTSTEKKTSKSKKERKKEKFDKLLKMEEISEKKSEIQKTILNQKSKNTKFEKKRKLDERKSKFTLEKEKERQEREKEKKIKETKRKEIEENEWRKNFMQSIDKLESLYDEAFKEKNKNLQSLIRFVSSICIESVDLCEEIEDDAKLEESVKKSVSSGKRKADETLTSCSNPVPTESLFGSKAVFSQRRRSRGRSSKREHSKSSSRKSSLSEDNSEKSSSLKNTSSRSPSFRSSSRSNSRCKSTGNSRSNSVTRSRSSSRSNSGIRSRRSSRSNSRSSSISGSGSSLARNLSSEKSLRSNAKTKGNSDLGNKNKLCSEGSETFGKKSELDDLQESICKLSFDELPHNREKSKLMQLFPEEKKTINEEICLESFFSISNQDFSYLNQSSKEEDVQEAIEALGLEIQRLYLDVLPLLTGKHLMHGRLINNKLVSEFIKLVILLSEIRGNSKKSS